MKNSWPTTVEELVDECKRLEDRYDLYTLGEKGEPLHGETEPRVDGTDYLAGEYQYGVAMVPAQWVTHVFSAPAEPDAATVGAGTCRLVDNDSGPDMHCTACGGEVDDEYRYFMDSWGYSRCPHCGARIIKEATE